MAFDFISAPVSFVCVFREGKRFSNHIVFSTDLKETVCQADESWQLIYVRPFSNVIDGLSHRLFLTQLSAESIDHIIRKMNPKGKDLRSFLKEIMG